MAKQSSKSPVFFCLLFFHLSSLAMFSYGTVHDSRSQNAIVKALSTHMQLKYFPFHFQVLVSDHGVLNSLSNGGGSAYFYSKQISGSKTYHRSHTPSVIINCGNRNDLQMLLPVLRSTRSALSRLHMEKHVRVSVLLPLPLLTSLSVEQKRQVDDVLHYMRKRKCFLIVEDSVGGEWNESDGLAQRIIEKSNLVRSLISHANLPVILAIKTSVFPLTRTLSSHRELLASFSHDSFDPPTATTTFPTAPVTNPTTPVTNPTSPTVLPPYNPVPTVVTVPGTSPVTGSPTLPDANPVPSTTPVSVPPVTPSTTPVAPVTNPGTQPVTNPVTTSPVTTPVTSPAVGNAPVVSGQTWCIAKTGAAQTALQSALDYACGIGGADCSTIQEGASCYNPNTLENHASYAFNSYFQKNPGATSCDFGGTAVLVNSNPSSGTCVYPSSATPSAPSTVPPATTAPSFVPPATTASTSGDTGTGTSYGSPPSVLNTSTGPTPGSSIGYGDGSPPFLTTPPSGSAGVKPFFGFVLLTASLYMTVLLGM